MHCPGKVDVGRAIDMELSGVGMHCFDVVVATGDGGGENEGHQGVHYYFET